MNGATNQSLQIRASSNPLFSLMQMAAKNDASTKYLAIEENFLLAAIHVAAMKHIPFAEGIPPDLPSDMPSVPSGCVFSFSLNSYRMLIKVEDFKMKSHTNDLLSNMINLWRIVE